MRFFYIWRIIAVAVAGLIFADERAVAQSFGLGVTNSASSILVSNSLTYTINITNLLGDQIPTALVSNVLPASVQFVGATTPQGAVTNYGGVTVFDLGAFGQAQIVQLTLTVFPTAAGFITNIVTVATTNFVNNFSVTTNSVTSVTNAPLPQADLGVALTGFAQATNLVNDLVAYGVVVTNSGSNDATAVTLTNTLPPGVILKKVSPANQSYSVVASNLIFNLGTLVSGSGTNLQFIVQPTNTGVLNFFVSIGAAGLLDTNSANNAASTNIAVINYLPGQLVVVTNSAQSVNQQNGLTEQSIRLANLGTNDVPAARILVTSLTKQLFNASGTNSGNPYVVLNTTLAAGQSVNLLLQFAPRGSFPLANSQLSALAVPVVNLTPPAPVATSSSLNISRLVTLANGNMLIEFPATLGRAYTVVYSDNVLFSNAMMAPPVITAPANRVQWIDYGPPATITSPTNSSARFYRVFQNP